LNKKSNFASSTSATKGVLCPLVWDTTAKNAAIGAGATAGAVIGAVAGAAVVGVGGKKGYDYLMAKNSPLGSVGNNPIYAPSPSAGNNPLFSG